MLIFTWPSSGNSGFPYCSRSFSASSMHGSIIARSLLIFSSARKNILSNFSRAFSKAASFCISPVRNADTASSVQMPRIAGADIDPRFLNKYEATQTSGAFVHKLMLDAERCLMPCFSKPFMLLAFRIGPKDRLHFCHHP